MEDMGQLYVTIASFLGKSPQYLERREAGPLGLS
jgi:hypothetical protein